MTGQKQATLDAIARAGIIATLRAPTAQGAIDACAALIDAGITAIEITYSTPDVPRVLAELNATYGQRIVLGAGTVLEVDEAVAAEAAGARFLVSPGLDDDVVAAMHRAGVVSFAGALTPTEVMRARRLGVDVIKLFPGGLGGPGLLKALRAPFPHLRFVPTGGVSAGNLGEWFSAGAFAVGAGGELCSADAIGRGDWDQIRGNAARFLAARTPA
ncbi:MAG TPA: bifunctional 4-hydroxy-2-oxoglutarate aldolase/2-dehydro-3-deoxy-phosphogluconate aldolase [Rugosimonospora sp.]